MSSIILTGTLGQVLHIDVTDYADSLSKMREWGARGFTSGEVPGGGYSLPYCMADTFDWALIGARPFTNGDGEPGVMHRGNFYKRRDLEASKKGKTVLPACVKFSRGARASDPEHLKEGEDGGFQYVTLIQFRSQGKSIPDFEVPRQQPQRPAQVAMPRPEPVAVAEPDALAITKDEANVFYTNLKRLLSMTIQADVDRLEYISVKLGITPTLTTLNGLTVHDVNTVLDAARKEPKAAAKAS